MLAIEWSATVARAGSPGACYFCNNDSSGKAILFLELVSTDLLPWFSFICPLDSLLFLCPSTMSWQPLPIPRRTVWVSLLLLLGRDPHTSQLTQLGSNPNLDLLREPDSQRQCSKYWLLSPLLLTLLPAAASASIYLRLIFEGPLALCVEHRFVHDRTTRRCERRGHTCSLPPYPRLP